MASSISHMLSEAYEKQNIIQSGADFTPTEIRNSLAKRCLIIANHFRSNIRGVEENFS